VQQNFYNVLEENSLLKIESTTKQGLINAHSEVKDIYEKYRKKTPSLRYVSIFKIQGEKFSSVVKYSEY